MTKTLQGIAIMGVIGYVGLMLLAEGRSGSNVQEDTTERVDVNDADYTSSSANVVWSGKPYSVVLSPNGNTYNIGSVSDGGFTPLKTVSGLWYAFDTADAAISKAVRLNNPQSGGVATDKQLEDAVPFDPYQNAIQPTDFGFGASTPAQGW
jgi:hypothetical protein